MTRVKEILRCDSCEGREGRMRYPFDPQRYHMLREARKELSKRMYEGGGQQVRLRRCESCGGWGRVCEGVVKGWDCWYPEGTIRVEIEDEREA